MTAHRRQERGVSMIPSRSHRRWIALVVFSMPFAGCSIAEGPTTPVVVPFSFERGQIVVEAYVNGHGPLRFLFDTATDPSSIDLATARSVGVTVKATGEPGEGAGSQATPTYDAPLSTLSVGPMVQRNVDAMAMDQKKLQSGFERPVVGVIGYSFMRNRIFSIDYTRRSITFSNQWPTDVSKERPLTSRLRLDRGDNVPLVEEVTLGGVQVVAQIDTGSSFGISLTPKATKRLGLQRIADAGTPAPGRGYNGATRATLGRIPVLEIGGVQFRDIEARFFSTGMGMDHASWDVNLGNPFLRQFLLVMDYHGRRIAFKRN
jgi:predicted aspartyl protease